MKENGINQHCLEYYYGPTVSKLRYRHIHVIVAHDAVRPSGPVLWCLVSRPEQLIMISDKIIKNIFIIVISIFCIIYDYGFDQVDYKHLIDAKYNF